MGTGFYGSNDLTNSVRALKEQASIPSAPTHHAHNYTTTMQYKTKTHKIHTDKHK